MQGMGLPSSERAQFSVVVHNVRITDCSPNTESSVVFDSMSDKSFFDLCVRTRGPLHADLIRVDLFDLNLAYGEGKAEKIVDDTGEDFVWRLLDIANRTMLATADLAGVDLDLKWDDKGERILPFRSIVVVGRCSPSIVHPHFTLSFIQPESFQLQYQTQGLKMLMT